MGLPSRQYSSLGFGRGHGVIRFIRFAINPIVYATYPIPKIAILPLVILIFGLGELSKVVVVAYVGLIIISALGYVFSVAADHIERELLLWRD